MVDFDTTGMIRLRAIRSCTSRMMLWNHRERWSRADRCRPRYKRWAHGSILRPADFFCQSYSSVG